ncbi:uncharacterized protein RHOBADRAFT_56211 [Rhodotorula graminis WP1]|uniref:Uncharacterized protein n=1 Tax=Rhodotorula graminis (strain WP1) TaxID=578459 RepID=A0A0N8PZE3_RHOGW|nr:uncharacterized protein RHOBADRAFT_56211 [Rhodotorula graminis WP1]KPV72085.1 hypothetical protein RHOBADRAFT_56211 [Rhodotorula graminis WP1]
MSSRRSSRNLAASAQLVPPARADSSSSAGTHGRRSRSCDSDASASTALTPVPESELKQATPHVGDEQTAPSQDIVDADKVESDASSSPRRSARHSGGTRPNYALVHDGDFDGTRSRKRQSSAVSDRAISPVATRSKRRRASERSSEVEVDDAASATPEIESSRRSPTGDEREGASLKPVEQATTTADLSPLTSPPDTSFDSNTRLPAPISSNMLSGPTSADEVRSTAVTASMSVGKIEDELVVRSDDSMRSHSGLKHGDIATDQAVARSSRRLAGVAHAAPRRKRQTPLSSPPPKAWFEVIVQGDAYAAVTAVAPVDPGDGSPFLPLVPLAIVRHDDSSVRHTFTTYRFPLFVSSDEPASIQDVIVRLKGSRKKVRGPSAEEIEGERVSGRAEGSDAGHWVAVLRSGEYRWIAP